MERFFNGLAVGWVLTMIVLSCIRDTDHAIVNAYAKKDTTNAAFVYYRGDQMVTIQGDTLMVRGEWVVVRNGKVVPE